jgi:hypothetical protein
MEIKVKVKNVYGVNTYYPACEKAKLLAQLAGTKTLTVSALQTIVALGYEVSEVYYDVSFFNNIIPVRN